MKSQKTANDIVYLLYKCFLYYNNRFYKITKGAKQRFEKKQWPLQRKAVVDRFILHSKITEKVINHFSGIDFKNLDVEFALKILFMFKAKTKNYPNPEIPYSFCISVLRMIQPIELPYTLWEGGIKGLGRYDKDPNIKYLYGSDNLHSSFSSILQDIDIHPTITDLTFSLTQINDLLNQSVRDIDSRIGISYYKELFFRNQHAYLIGYIEHKSSISPFALAFENDKKGVRIDALLTDEESIKHIFSFSRSYMQINSSNTAALVEYISKILPTKHIGQLYINLGYHEFGREMLLLELYNKIKAPEFQFSLKESTSNSGFLVLTNDFLDYDIKIASNVDTNQLGIPLSDFVEAHKNAILLDRVGRIPDSQYFEKLYFPLNSFTPELNVAIQKSIYPNISLGTDKIEIHHLFLERKSKALTTALETCKTDLERVELLNDLGKCIKELAMTGILIEHISIEDFGISKEGKVIFQRLYKIRKISEYEFTTVSKKDTANANYPSNSIIPDNYLNELFQKRKWKKEFLISNKELYKSRFWNLMKKSNKPSKIVDLKPYQSNIHHNLL